ncbi:hypothetical protein N1027_10705 [Herbiconiux sp. CPCC 205763]|uniref:Uncharacterized protein n=1 Tax=Herbiconiux aconitum TaxID=2970913 RepID=A0ABT2GQV6_9MICO|nr:hypothetical protein [Herbiconiux aconitum]MCS5718603.1 hypothetical protein [Herbiconiux aconitum]
MNPEILTLLCTYRSADVLDGSVDVVAPQALGAVAAPLLADAGYRRQDYWETTRTFRVGDACSRVSYSDFSAETKQVVISILDEAAPRAEGNAQRRITATRTALVRDERGARSWLRRAVEVARDQIPDLSAEEEARIPAPVRSTVPARPPRREDVAIQRALERASAEDDARVVLSRWLPTLPDGPHPLPEVWEAFDAARQQSKGGLDAYPGALLIGRNAFYRIAAELADVRSVGARRRVLEIPYELRVRSLLRRRQLVAALRLQRAR